MVYIIWSTQMSGMLQVFWYGCGCGLSVKIVCSIFIFPFSFLHFVLYHRWNIGFIVLNWVHHLTKRIQWQNASNFTCIMLLLSALDIKLECSWIWFALDEVLICVFLFGVVVVVWPRRLCVHKWRYNIQLLWLIIDL